MWVAILSELALYAYLACVAVLAAYALHSLWLLWAYLRHRQEALRLASAEETLFLPSNRPHVLVQIPVFNERDVVSRVVETVGRLRWPTDRLRIQLLDDSTDDSVSIGARAIADLQAAGLDAIVVRRASRRGFKAGALAEGMEVDANRPDGPAEFIAIFDADFLPEPDFLERAMKPLLADPGLGLVQGRWGHLNRDTNRLTRAQALGIDAHFAIEQGARAWSGLPMNFNGTCGVWRREAIVAGGGWHGDTLTEDMDLSYRVQLAGWRLTYRVGLVVPGEIPSTVAAWRGQQFRWAKGSLQTAQKLMPAVWRSAWPLSAKVAATFHMTHYLVHPLIVATLVTAPFAMGALQTLSSAAVALGAALFAVGVGSPMILYAASQFVLDRAGALRRIRDIPFIAAIGTGIALSNTRAAWQVMMRRATPFERTPKQGAGHQGTYKVPLASGTAEIAAGVWATGGALFGAFGPRPWTGLLLVIYAAGFVWTGLELERQRCSEDQRPNSSGRWLLLLGLLTLLGHGALGVLAGTWRERPALYAGLGLTLAGLYLASVFTVRHRTVNRASMWWIVVVSVLIRLFALGIAPSDDVNRYIVEGTQVRFGENPYSVSPADTTLRSVLPKEVLSGVNHVDWTAIYPPATLLAEALITDAGDGPEAFKVASLLADLVGLVVLALLLSRHGLPASWLLLAGWNPTGTIFGAGEGHHDFMMAALMAAGWYLWSAHRRSAGILLATLATLTKPFAAVAFAPMVRQLKARHVFLGVSLVAVAYAPFLGDVGAVFRSLSRFGTEMHFHGALEPPLRWVMGMLVPSERVGGITALLLVLMWLGASWCILIVAARGSWVGPQTAAVLVAILLVCSPTLHPWYLAPLVLLLPFTKGWSLVVWTAMSPIYWLHGLGFTPEVSWVELPWATALAHGPAFLLFALETYRWWRTSGSRGPATRVLVEGGVTSRSAPGLEHSR